MKKKSLTDLSATQLAPLVGISRRTIDRFRVGANISTDVLRKLVSYSNMSYDEVMALQTWYLIRSHTIQLYQVDSVLGRDCYVSRSASGHENACYCFIDNILYQCSKDFEPSHPVSDTYTYLFKLKEVK